MRKTIALFCISIVVVMIIGVISANAGTVTLQWDKSTGADGYNVFVDGTKYSSTPEQTVTVTVPAGEHSFYVTAYNAWGESSPSNTVTTPPLPVAPGNTRITVIVDVQQGQ